MHGRVDGVSPLLREVVLGRSELAKAPRFRTNALRSAARGELTALITAAFSALTADEVAQRLELAGIANARVNEMEEVWRHPQLAARNRWREVQSPSGPIPALLPPGAADDPDAAMGEVPFVGQHNDAILAELGLSAGGASVVGDEVPSSKL